MFPIRRRQRRPASPAARDPGPAAAAAVADLPPLDCAGCAACCRDTVIVDEAFGDDPTQYDTVPVDDGTFRALRRRPDGACTYLADGRCTIYERRPALCRAFDCRGLVRSRSRRAIRQGIRDGVLDRDVVRAGRKRLRHLR